MVHLFYKLHSRDYRLSKHCKFHNIFSPTFPVILPQMVASSHRSENFHGLDKNMYLNASEDKCSPSARLTTLIETRSHRLN